MMRGNPESLTVNNPREVDKGRRNLLVRATKLAGAGAAIYALSKIEPAYAAVKKIADVKDRRGNINSTNSSSLDIPATIDTSQGQSGNVQGTPTPDATVAALQKRIHQLESPPQQSWLDSNLAILIGFAGTAATIVVGIYQFSKNQRSAQEIQRSAQEQHKDERFQNAIAGLGSDKIDTRAASATMLLTFLQQKGYERFHQPIFNLAVNHLRLREVDDPKNPKPPDALDQAFITVFTEAVLRVREELERDKVESEKYRKFLDASRVHLDGVYLYGVDLSNVYMREASFIRANLHQVNLTEANLEGANLSRADLTKANLTLADLTRADLTRADLTGADLIKTNLTEAKLTEVPSLPWANLEGANLSRADLTKANLTRAHLTQINLTNANLTEANLTRAHLTQVDLSRANLTLANLTDANLTDANLTLANLTDANLTLANLTNAELGGANLTNAELGDANLTLANLTNAELEGANPEVARFLKSTKMWDVKNYPQEKLQKCEGKEASIKPPSPSPDTKG